MIGRSGSRATRFIASAPVTLNRAHPVTLLTRLMRPARIPQSNLPTLVRVLTRSATHPILHDPTVSHLLPQAWMIHSIWWGPASLLQGGGGTTSWQGGSRGAGSSGRSGNKPLSAEDIANITTTQLFVGGLVR